MTCILPRNPMASHIICRKIISNTEYILPFALSLYNVLDENDCIYVAFYADIKFDWNGIVNTIMTRFHLGYMN